MMKLGMKSEWHCRITQIQSKIYCNIVKQKSLWNLRWVRLIERLSILAMINDQTPVVRFWRYVILQSSIKIKENLIKGLAVLKYLIEFSCFMRGRITTKKLTWVSKAALQKHLYYTWPSSLVSVMDISSSGCLSFTLNYSPTICGSHRQLLRSCPCCDLKGDNCKCDRIWASKKLTLSASYLLWRSNGESILWVDVVQRTLWPGDVCRP